eukprot:scaffold2562_cov354-Prasinococcus_capsulatus_cf.AAC.3
MTGENWNDVMFNSVRAVGWAACIFFVIVFVLGNTILFNLFLAVLIDSFAEKREQTNRLLRAKRLERAASQASNRSDSFSGMRYAAR